MTVRRCRSVSLVLALFCALLSASPDARAGELFQWEDAKGVVQTGPYPPAGARKLRRFVDSVNEAPAAAESGQPERALPDPIDGHDGVWWRIQAHKHIHFLEQAKRIARKAELDYNGNTESLAESGLRSFMESKQDDVKREQGRYDAFMSKARKLGVPAEWLTKLKPGEALALAKKNPLPRRSGPRPVDDSGPRMGGWTRARWREEYRSTGEAIKAAERLVDAAYADSLSSVRYDDVYARRLESERAALERRQEERSILWRRAHAARVPAQWLEHDTAPKR